MANLQLIKEFAEERNISLSDIANELGITPQALSKLMRNNSTKIDTLEKIADILKVSVSAFFEPKPNVSQNSAGDYSPNIYGDGNVFSIEVPKIAASLLAEITKQRSASQESLNESQRQLAKSQEQIDRLLSIIEKIQP